jgi:hypothetical protein
MVPSSLLKHVEKTRTVLVEICAIGVVPFGPVAAKVGLREGILAGVERLLPKCPVRGQRGWHEVRTSLRRWPRRDPDLGAYISHE